MLKDGIYNVDVYWPQEIKEALDKKLSMCYYIECTRHYCERAVYNRIPIGAYKLALYGKVVELEVSHGLISKIITRIDDSIKSGRSFCFAVSFGKVHRCNSGALIPAVAIKTVWVNNIDDNHYTLKKERFVNE